MQLLNLSIDLDRDALSNTSWCFLNLKPIAFFLSPYKRLSPVNPRATKFNMKAIALFIKGATSQAISRLEHNGAQPSLLKISRRSYTGKSTSDDHNIV